MDAKHATTTIPTICTFVLIAACHRRLSENERKLIGTGDRTGLDTAEQTIYRSDHSMENTISPAQVRSHSLKVLGDSRELFLSKNPPVHWQPVPVRHFSQNKLFATTIVEMQADKVVREKGRPPLIRVK